MMLMIQQQIMYDINETKSKMRWFVIKMTRTEASHFNVNFESTQNYIKDVCVCYSRSRLEIECYTFWRAFNDGKNKIELTDVC